MAEAVQLAFASCTEDLAGALTGQMRALVPGVELLVISEFPVNGARWVPYHPRRRFRDNLALCRSAVGGRRIQMAGVVLQPQVPFHRMRLMALLMAPTRILCFNEEMGHFPLRSRAAPAILRHIVWRTKNLLRWQVFGGGVVRQTWERLRRPVGRRIWFWYWRARLAGRVAQCWKSMSLPERRPTATAHPTEAGISVVIPSRDGRELLERCLPLVVSDAPRAEIIVVDNGSTDGTAEWLSEHHPTVRVIESDCALSFARAVNLGLEAAERSHICLLNNDMAIQPGFFEALREAFERVPDLFCATAQILFPEGVRREETGKTVLAGKTVEPTDFPIRCDEPLEGEDLSYVLYGSGGCSLYERAKLRSFGGMDESFDPAYVEDLDLGWRGWQQGWPTVYVAGAKVLHNHRATTSRYYSPEELEGFVEVHYLQFLSRTVLSHRLFGREWRRAIRRLSLLGESRPAAAKALRESVALLNWMRPPAIQAARDEAIAALGSGDVAVFPGREMSGRPVVAVASPFLPFPTASGGAVRMWNLLSRAAEDFDIVLVSFVDQLATPREGLRHICNEIVTVRRVGTHLRKRTQLPDDVEEFRSEAFAAALRETVRKWRPCLVQLEFTSMAQYARDCGTAKTVLVEHDLNFDLYRQFAALSNDWEARHQAERWARYERQAWRDVDCVVTVSEEDQERVTARCVECLPNGVDTTYFRPSRAEPEPGRLLFVGSFGHLPNLLGLAFFLREVWSKVQSGSTLQILGGARREVYLRRFRHIVELNLNQAGIEVQGFVPDIRPAYERAEIVVAPLVAAAGTNIKILEAMAMGKAVITTPVGTAGLKVTPGVNIIEAATAEDLAGAIRNLQKDATRRVEIGQAARATVERKYGWNLIAAKQQELYRRLIPAAMGHPAG